MNIEKEKERLAELAKYNHQVKVLDALDRLMVNPDFAILYNSYTEEFALKLVDDISPLVKDGKSTDTIQQQLQAISLFKSYINYVRYNGNSAKESIDQQEE